MTKTYSVMVVSIGEVVEEEVVLLVGSVEVKCFLTYCPSRIVVGGRYDAEFQLDLPDGDCVTLSESKKIAVENIGGGFSCLIYGYLDGSVFQSFIDFSDLEIHYEYPYLNEKYVKVSVDRIDVAFV